jgi:hypothetical protein
MYLDLKMKYTKMGMRKPKYHYKDSLIVADISEFR